MSTKNPYNLNTQENKFLAWAAGFESNNDDNPFSEDIDIESYKIWNQGHASNKTRAAKPINLNAVASNEVREDRTTHAVVTLPGLDLSAIPTDQLFKEASKRISEGEALLLRVKKLLG
jgi:hypothetical protein